MKIHCLDTEKAIREGRRCDADPTEVAKIALDQIETLAYKPEMVIVLCSFTDDDGDECFFMQDAGGNCRDLQRLLCDGIALSVRDAFDREEFDSS